MADGTEAMVDSSGFEELVDGAGRESRTVIGDHDPRWTVASEGLLKEKPDLRRGGFLGEDLGRQWEPGVAISWTFLRTASEMRRIGGTAFRSEPMVSLSGCARPSPVQR